MSAAFDYEPETSRTCVVCGCGQNTNEAAMGKFMQAGKIVDAHLLCADRHNLNAIDGFIRDGE